MTTKPDIACRGMTRLGDMRLQGVVYMVEPQAGPP